MAPKAMVLPNQASSNCDTTDSVTTIRLPSPVALQRHKLLNGHLWLKWKTDAEHQGPAHNYDYNDYSQREIREPRDDMKTRRPPRQESLLQWCVVVCVTIITTVWRRKRQTMVTTTGAQAQGEGRHGDTTTRTTAIVTTMQDRLHERLSTKRPTTSLDYVIRLTDRLQRLRSKMLRIFSHKYEYL